ncbi:MAG: ParB/RepB/Spo0J family partition protein [Proteobacteria bacterium]|nr:ParB/RepB/Spo0J family partition protein [Pseudomonadota bacterium]MBU4259081.1 ParB/RepB/Spo0J family partition protein [Pseudomonadota bacterium]MBU4288767.1 ParB/RepB/Spo0J family partition protein [Pseudomonadota bacterium]
MVKIIEVKDIPLDDLVIGKGQVRVRDVGKDIDELADSIDKRGLLQPIVVCPTDELGKYEILTGQRRFLAHKLLKRQTIQASVFDQKVDEIEAKIISVTENLVRRDPNSQDYIDSCTWLYRKYGSIKAVAEELGISPAKVSTFVKYDRLKPELKKMVENEGIDIKVALRAQDAASVTGEFDPQEAIKLAKELSKMSGAQQAHVVKRLEKEPKADVDEVIEAAKTGEKVTQVIVTLGVMLHQSLKQYAKDEGTKTDEAARILVEEGLMGKGYTIEEE